MCIEVFLSGERANPLKKTEHNTLYQTNFYNAQNVFLGFQQSETAYWQGPGQAAIAPVPWADNLVASDPTFSWCAAGDAAVRWQTTTIPTSE